MKTENLDKAWQASSHTLDLVRLAHQDAIAAGNQFAEIVLLDMIGRAATLRKDIHSALAAGKATNEK